MSNKHILKVWPQFFVPITQGLKSCEFRINDRNFQIGDDLLLSEFDSIKQSFTGRQIVAQILWIDDLTPVLASFENFVLLHFYVTHYYQGS